MGGVHFCHSLIVSCYIDSHAYVPFLRPGSLPSTPSVPYYVTHMYVDTDVSNALTRLDASDALGTSVSTYK